MSEDIPVLDREVEERRQSKSVLELIEKIRSNTNQIPVILINSPKIQRDCLKKLGDAELNLDSYIKEGEIESLLHARMFLSEVEIELTRAYSGQRSFRIVGLVSYAFIIFMGVLFSLSFFGYADILGIGNDAATLNSMILMGVPIPVWIWSIIGSLTSMLLRAGQSPFKDFDEAKRWLLYRPIVGMFMGIVTYLLIITGLIVFSGKADTQTPELIWVIAFIGSFSDTLSINLLQRLIGQFKPIGKEEEQTTSD